MKYGLIGERLGHSFSKLIHQRLFDYEYELKEISKDDLDAFMTARDFMAINVTIPYKEAVIPYLDEISPIAREVGAVNTILHRDGQLYGDNTDFDGLLALLRHANISLKDRHVLILGSGGTSKTALAVARHLGCRSVHRVSRKGTGDCLTYEQAATLTQTQVIINTTPCGMFPHIGESAISLEGFPHLTGVADAVYNPLRSHLVCEAQKSGVPAEGGLYMLVAQAVAAAEKFTGQSVGVAAADRIFTELMSEKQNIVLIGMPGCGKTTVGKLLSEKRGMPLIDTDEEIVKREGRSIPEIFTAVGEEGFRQIESAVIREVSAMQGVVIATGGGAVLRQENVSLLKENGRLYFLDRPLDLLVATADRPLSSDREALQRRFDERYDTYCSCCDRHLISDGTAEQTLHDIEEDVDREIIDTQRS